MKRLVWNSWMFFRFGELPVSQRKNTMKIMDIFCANFEGWANFMLRENRKILISGQSHLEILGNKSDFLGT